MEAALWSLAATLLGVPAFLAYRHPEPYRKYVAPPLLIAATLISLQTVSFYLAGAEGNAKSLVKGLAESAPMLATAREVAAELVATLRLVLYWIYGYVAFCVYVYGLTWLQKLGLVSPAEKAA